MRDLWAAILAARQRRAVEKVLAGLHSRGQMVMAVRVLDAYVRIYVPYALGGVIALSPRTAERYLMEIEDREFQRALAAR